MNNLMNAFFSLLCGTGEEDEHGYGGILYERFVLNRPMPHKFVDEKMAAITNVLKALNPETEKTPRTKANQKVVEDLQAKLKAQEEQMAEMKALLESARASPSPSPSKKRAKTSG